MKYASMYERLVANSEKPDDQNENGCWVWTGRHTKAYGRVNLWRDGKHTTCAAHREMENLFRDEPLDGFEETVDHLCGNTLCINPDHWEVVPNAENARRSILANPRGIWRGA